MNQSDIYAIYGFTKEEAEDILGPSYIEAHKQAKIEYEEMKNRIIAQSQQMAQQLSEISQANGGPPIEYTVEDVLKRKA